MLNGQRAAIFLQNMEQRVKPSYKKDNTDKVRCYVITKAQSKIQIFFDAKTSKKCLFKFDHEIPNSIHGVTDIQVISEYSTAIERTAIAPITLLYQCYLYDENTLNELLEYFENKVTII
ncbi:hypothetical protein V8P49_16475 [Acinetobacter baumannii]